MGWRPVDVRGSETPPSDHAKGLHLESAEACNPDVPAEKNQLPYFPPYLQSPFTMLKITLLILEIVQL